MTFDAMTVHAAALLATVAVFLAVWIPCWFFADWLYERARRRQRDDFFARQPRAKDYVKIREPYGRVVVDDLEGYIRTPEVQAQVKAVRQLKRRKKQ